MGVARRSRRCNGPGFRLVGRNSSEGYSRTCQRCAQHAAHRRGVPDSSRHGIRRRPVACAGWCTLQCRRVHRGARAEPRAPGHIACMVPCGTGPASQLGCNSLSSEDRVMVGSGPASGPPRSFVIGLAAALLTVTPIAARDDSTVRENLPGCQAAIDDQATVADRVGAAGRCTGIIETLIFLGGRLPADLQFCVPGQSATMKSFGSSPTNSKSSMGLWRTESFTISAMAILHTRWPCNAPKQ